MSASFASETFDLADKFTNDATSPSLVRDPRDGNLKWGGHNLCPQPENLSGSEWSDLRVNLGYTDSNGMTLVTADGTNDTHLLRTDPFSITNGWTVTIGWVLEYVDWRWFEVREDRTDARIRIDALNQTIEATNDGSASTILASGVTHIAGDRYLYWFKFPLDNPAEVTATVDLRFAANNTSGGVGAHVNTGSIKAGMPRMYLSDFGGMQAINDGPDPFYFAHNLAVTGVAPRVHMSWDNDNASCIRGDNDGVNHITNTALEGVALGVVSSAGSMPTDMSTSDPTVAEIVGFGVQDGIPYFDIKYDGTIPLNFLQISLGPTVTVGASENWVESCFVALVDGDLTNVVAVQVSWNHGNPSYAGQFDQNLTLTSELTRFHKHGITPTGTTAGTPFIKAVLDGTNQTVNFTLRIGMPQFENAVHPSMPIPTYGAATARVTDELTADLNDVCPGFRQGAFSSLGDAAMFFESGGAGFNTLWEIREDAENRVESRVRESNGMVRLQVEVDDSVEVYQSTTIGSGDRYRQAFRLGKNDLAVSVNGDTPDTDTSVTPLAIDASTILLGDAAGFKKHRGVPKG